MWNMKCFVIPVIIGATEIVTKGLKKIWKQYQESIQQISTKSSCTRNITHYKESATIRNLKLEWWGAPLVQEEKYQEKPVKREEEIIIIIIIIHTMEQHPSLELTVVQLVKKFTTFYET
jgi:hypothetical protein